MVDFVVGKALDSMDVEHELYKRWGMPDEHRGQADTHRAD
jgi:4-hydroxy-3-polyprenylbenzoate decarboxylase